MQKEIKRIHVLQAGLFLGIFYAALGLLVGVLYGGVMMLMGALVGTAGASGTSGGASGPGAAEMFAMMGAMGLFMVILIPIFYGALGFIGGIIGAAFYNLVARWVGGLKFDVTDLGPTPGELPTTAVAQQHS